MFVFAFDNTDNGDNKVERNSHIKDFPPRVYTTGSLLDYQYFKDHYQLIAVDLNKQKELDADPRAIQQTEFYGMLKTNSQVCTVLEKSKETVLEFYKGTPKILKRTYKWLNTTQ